MPETTPHGLDGAGLALWHQLHESLEFSITERQIAVELCRTITLCELLGKELDRSGLVVEGQRGPRVNPLAAELRQQRLVAARLVANLNIPPMPDSSLAGSLTSREVAARNE